jgi:hypothetical protein
MDMVLASRIIQGNEGKFPASREIWEFENPAHEFDGVDSPSRLFVIRDCGHDTDSTNRLRSSASRFYRFGLDLSQSVSCIPVMP